MGRSKYRPNWNYKMGNDELPKADKEKDLGIIIHNDLSPDGCMNKLFMESLAVLSNIQMSFNFMNESVMKR